MEIQAERIKRLETALKGAEGAERILILAELANAIGESDPGESMFLAEQAFAQGTRDDAPLPGCEAGVASALLSLAIGKARRSEYGAAFTDTRRALEICEKMGEPQDIANAIRAHGNVHLFRGEFREARAPLEKALRIYREIGDLAGCSKCILSLGSVGFWLGDMRTAERLFTFGLRLERRAPDAEVRAKLLYYLNEIRQSRGEDVEAVASLLECLELFEEIGDREGLFHSWKSLAETYVRLHRYATARDSYEKALTIAREEGRPAYEVTTLTGIAELDLKAGHSDDSLTKARDALRIASDLDDRKNRASALRALGTILRRLGKLAEARASLEAALEMERAEGIRANEVECLVELGEVQLGRGDHGGAVAILNEAETICREVGHGSLRVRVLLALGRAHLARGDPGTAAETLDTGLDLARVQGARDLKVKLHRLLADAWRDLGDSRKGLDHMTRFHDLECELRGGEYEDLLEKLVSVQELERSRQEARSQREVTERLKVLNRELERTNRELSGANHAKTEMLGIVIHDLRDPLTAVLGYATLGERQATGRDRDLFVRIRGAAERTAEIIQSLVGAQQLEGGDLALAEEPVDLAELAWEAVTDHEPGAAAKGIRLSVRTLPHVPVATGDSRACRAVLDNLISNAVKFGSDGDRVEVRVGSEEEVDTARLEVTDTGPGIPADEQGLLFTKFARLSPRPTASEVSTGLGLYSVKLLVSAMKGEVSCRSEVGRGSTFRMDLPVAG